MSLWWYFSSVVCLYSLHISSCISGGGYEVGELDVHGHRCALDLFLF